MGKVILVIDDDAVERELLRRCLAAAGHRVLLAADGTLGLAAAAESAPDLVVLDVVMPHLNGFQACRSLRELPATAATPIVILTSKDQATDRFWAAEVGATAYLTKPVDVPRLLQLVTELTG